MAYYVYELFDPETDLVFYVGKGTGNRIDAHELEAKAGRVSRKCQTIRDIHSKELKVGKRRVRSFADEQDAYDFEAAHIESIGLDNLTNVIPGGGLARGGYTLRHDRQSVSAIAELLNRTNGVPGISFTVGGRTQRLMFAELRKHWVQSIADIVSRRGVNWVNQIASHYKVAFNG